MRSDPREPRPVRRSVRPPSSVARTFARLDCEHIAALLKSTAEVPPVVASFLGLGAARNGWLVHGSLPGQADVDRENLTEAGLDVVGLTAKGQLEIMELNLTLAPDRWVRPWSLRLDQRMAEGFDALWFARFPVDANEGEIADVLPFEEAWLRCFAGRRVVTLCPYIVGDMAADMRRAQLDDISSVHDRVVAVGAAVSSRH